ncbi:MAG: hypothetical protein DWQ37_22375 [Planctomycetota bacterium]|nr:MAG: hypothetical protein DWQ37_22375 [Planctomycetota bacterium]
MARARFHLTTLFLAVCVAAVWALAIRTVGLERVAFALSAVAFFWAPIILVSFAIVAPCRSSRRGRF